MSANIRTEIVGENSRAAIGLLLDRLLTAGVQFSVEPTPNRMHPDVLPGWMVSWAEPRVDAGVAPQTGAAA